MESELVVLPAASKQEKIYQNPHFMSIFLKRWKKNVLNVLIKQWIQKAMDLAKEEDRIELENIMGRYLSPKFLKVRKVYLTELNKVLARGLNKFKSNEKKIFKSSSRSVRLKSSVFNIKILLPVKHVRKKLRDIGILHKILVRPTSKLSFSRLKDYEIISWYSLIAKRLWNYYSCVDSVGTVGVICLF